MDFRPVHVPAARPPWTLQARTAGASAFALLVLVAAGLGGTPAASEPGGAGRPPQPPAPPVPGAPRPTGPGRLPEGPPGPALAFGFDAESIALQRSLGVEADYASVWIGVWNLEKGWGGPADELAALRALGVTPAIHFYYWGDDLSPACLESGCGGKSVAGWDLLAEELVVHLQAALEGAPVLIVLESEFNKASVASHEPLDALLAAKADRFKQAYPAARVVLGIGGWHPAAWGTWDRAAAASDAVGIQAMAGSVPEAGHEADGPTGLFEETLAGVQRLRALFAKPIVLQDVAVPSGPDPATPATQAEVLAPFVANRSAFKAEGVDTILYRSFVDHPSAPASRYFGEAERHFGLAAPDTGALKPSGEEWVDAMREERAGRVRLPS